ncbi:hypothetical protein C4579_04795 [Candidatus Microgenomates bacterium]|nr:MAG: hypothetical protein C4579_04795 [Candidatus Microgenomates bacterium]
MAKNNYRSWFSFLTRSSYTPVIVLVIALPILLAFALQPGVFSLSSRADKIPQLRVWLEPSSVRAQSGEVVTLKAYAALDDETNLVSTIQAHIANDNNVQIFPSEISYNSPFRGKTVIAEITVTAPSAGTYTIGFDQNITTNINPISIVTGSTTLRVE